MNQTYTVHYLGCKTNQSDALSYAGILQRAGWREAADTESPGLIVVQSCTVTMSADAQGRQMVRGLKRKYPHSKILMTGCYAENLNRFRQSIPEVDYVIGNLNPDRFQILSQIASADVAEVYPDFPMPAESMRSRPYIKIQEGCDARCSYCIIPAVRSKSKSLPPDEVLRRVEYYRDRGYREMIFTGISMGGYGKDLSPRCSLSVLMKKVDRLPGEFKIRLSSLEPEEIDQEFIDVFTTSRKFQPHLHLPLQSASDRVLKKMRRQYLLRHYDSIILRIFDKIPDLNLGSDILVGFPEEDEPAFLTTKRYIQETPFSYLHVFPFSPRPETPAAAYPRAASPMKIKQRAAGLRRLSKEKNLLYRKKFLGRKLAALLLSGGKEALTDNYIRVSVGEEVKEVRQVSVLIETVEEECTTGRVLK